MAERKPAEPAHPVGYREARRVGWGPNEFTLRWGGEARASPMTK